jgi:hypothetical protein
MAKFFRVEFTEDDKTMASIGFEPPEIDDDSRHANVTIEMTIDCPLNLVPELTVGLRRVALLAIGGYADLAAPSQGPAN